MFGGSGGEAVPQEEVITARVVDSAVQDVASTIATELSARKLSPQQEERVQDVVEGVVVEHAIADQYTALHAQMSALLEATSKQKQVEAAVSSALAETDVDLKKTHDLKTRVGFREYKIASAEAASTIVNREMPGSLASVFAAQHVDTCRELYQVKFKHKALDTLEKVPKAIIAAATAAATAIAKIVSEQVAKIKTWWNSPDIKAKREAVTKWFKETFEKIDKATQPLRQAIIDAAKATGAAMHKGAVYVGDKAKEFGTYVAGTEIGKRIAKAGKSAGKAITKLSHDVAGKWRAATAAVSAGIGAKLASAGAKMQEQQEKYTKAAETVKKFRADKSPDTQAKLQANLAAARLKRSLADKTFQTGVKQQKAKDDKGRSV